MLVEDVTKLILIEGQGSQPLWGHCPFICSVESRCAYLQAIGLTSQQAAEEFIPYGIKDSFIFI